MANARYPKGSEWRRWDLHVHTPASVLYEEFDDWDTYIAELETAGAGVSVVGITDYCTIEGYKQILSYHRSGRLGGFDLLLPNIEFRMTPELPGGKAVNIHLLLSPEDPEHVEKIEQALGKLTFSYNGDPYSCVPTELRKLGQKVNAKATESSSQLRAGINAFKPPFEQFREWRTSNRWLTANSLVVISNAKDGASGLSKDSGFAAVRAEMYRFADMIFSGNPKDRAYFLGNGSDSAETIVAEKGTIMPCIHGSDAHSAEKLFAPEEDRFCWIKADPTFEGLRQLLYEPDDRVYIGPTPPSAFDKSKIIGGVTITGGDSWFDTPAIKLNPGLVAVIGEKGSGKTALADMIAYSCGAWTGESSTSSFITKAEPYLDGVRVAVNWEDGHRSEAALHMRPPARGPEVRYLSQDFVEQLCSQDFKGAKLIAEVESVIFSHLDEADRLGASSFEDLRRIKTAQIEEHKTEIRGRLSQLNSEIVRTENEIATKPQKQTRQEELAKTIAAIDKQLPELQGSIDQNVAEQLMTERTLLKNATEQLAELNKRKTAISDGRARVQRLFRTVDDQFNAVAAELRMLGLTEEQVAQFRPMVSGNPSGLLDDLEKIVDDKANDLRGDAENPTPAGQSIVDLKHRIVALEQSVATDELVRSRLIELQKQKEKAQSESVRLTREIDRIDGTLSTALAKRREDRWTAYLTYFDVLSEERTALEAMYAPLSDVIATDESDGTKSGFELNVRQVADAKSWIETGLDLLDRRRSAGNDLSQEDTGKQLDRGLASAWRFGSKADIRRELEGVLKQLAIDGVKADRHLVSHATRQKLYDWLFSPEYIRLEYGLKYQGTELDALSPGTRGIVLLILYLAMDHTDRRPLIIDQPEGNLDNSSIFEALVPFLRRAKRMRQVILVTHNPNLVATTDAEQVIVAFSKKSPGEPHARITYLSGSLEHVDGATGTRDQAVRLLEGGKQPFKIREGRWRIVDLYRAIQ